MIKLFILIFIKYIPIIINNVYNISGKVLPITLCIPIFFISSISDIIYNN